MPRQRTHHSRMVYVFPNDFPQRLKRFQRESGLPWAELQRLLGADRETVRRRRDKERCPAPGIMRRYRWRRTPKVMPCAFCLDGSRRAGRQGGSIYVGISRTFGAVTES